MEQIEQLKLLLEGLNAIRQEFITDNLKVYGFFLLIIGWLISSEKTRAYLSNHKQVKPYAIIVLIAAASVHTFYATVSFFASKYQVARIQSLDLVQELESVSKGFYDWQQISLARLLFHLALVTTLLILISSLIIKQRTNLKT